LPSTAQVLNAIEQAL